MILIDQQQREQALDPAQSFIVQAPAGSGKTELLSQRFLVLLSKVKQPEEILAITFTKKSAAEMRARILRALTRAQEESEPLNQHDKKTWLLAKNALQQNEKCSWNILDNPNRLQIQTIDSFNSTIARQLPLLSHFGGTVEIADDPIWLYQTAIRELFSLLEENTSWSQSIAKLLLHLDNDINNAEKLLISMLAKRDQWLPTLAANTPTPELRHILENNLNHVISEHLQKLSREISQKDDVVRLLKFAASNLNEDNPIFCWNELHNFPGVDACNQKYWLAIFNILFSQSNSTYDWRKSITIKQGFPATEKKLKQELLDLIETLSKNEKLKDLFIELTYLPEAKYQETQWEILAALHIVLTLAAAQLTIVFRQYGNIDYIENAQAALRALGEEDNPTDIALAFDYKLQHILIDEFQDTSVSQFHLLKKLTANWLANEGRTLFLVGDPMQSIYRFREAEVGLFMLTQQRGINQIKLHPLTLQANFRSSPAVIDWINHHFPSVFPNEANILTGAVNFTPSIPSRTLEQQHLVKLCPFFNSDENEQGHEIINIIKQTRETTPEAKIAILVRSRSHLVKMLPILKNANIGFRALDIDSLQSRPSIQDLIVLTKALHNLADRLAWISLLRAPWCGLLLSDLLIIANHPCGTIWQQLQAENIFHLISQDGQQRLNRILPHLKLALAERRRYPIREWIENTWVQIGGPACLTQEIDLEDTNAFFNLLEKLDESYCLNNSDQFMHALEKLYAAPDNTANDLLQIMTIHNAKGLEFDTVILPHLERSPNHDSAQLLQWMEGPDERLLLAPIEEIGDKENAINDYIKHQRSLKANHENSRLLYVAATRAKNQLYLLFNLKLDEKESIKQPTNNTLLRKLWKTISADIKVTKIANISLPDNQNNTVALTRIQTGWISPCTQNKFSTIAKYDNKPGFALTDPTPAIIGTVIHKIFETISIQDLQHYHQTAFQKYIKNQLLQKGLIENNLENASQIVSNAISNTLKDPRGQWILKSYPDMANEMSLSAIINGQLKHLVIDKTFVDEQGIRWIIDYKSTINSDKDIKKFLAAQKAKYQQQLSEYAEALSVIESKPIRLGLYFPLIPSWIELSKTSNQDGLMPNGEGLLSSDSVWF